MVLLPSAVATIGTCSTAGVDVPAEDPFTKYGNH
jgi:hypothetical protein